MTTTPFHRTAAAAERAAHVQVADGAESPQSQMDRRKAWLLVALLGCGVLTPAVPLGAGLPDVRVEQLLALPALGFVARELWRCKGQVRSPGAVIDQSFQRPAHPRTTPVDAKGEPKRPAGAIARLGAFAQRCHLGGIDLALGALAVATLASIAYARWVLSEGVGVRDLYEVAKPGLYWLLFRFAFVASAREPARSLGRTALLVAGALAALVALTQYFDWLGVAGRAGHWWAPEHHLRELTRDGRAFGTVGNPNYFGALMALVAAVALAVVTFGGRSVPGATRSRVSLGLRAAACALVLATLGVVLSGSRGALGMLLIAAVVVGASGAATGRVESGWRRLVSGGMVLMVGLMASVLLVEAFPRGRQDYLARVGGALSPTGDSTLALRLERWRTTLFGDGGGEDGNELRNGGVERGDDHASEFRFLPGTDYRRAPEAAHSGGFGLIFRGHLGEPSRRAAVFQQRYVDSIAGARFEASVWVNVREGARGTVELYTNVLYADGDRADPYERIAADPTLAGQWQRLSVTMTPEPGRRVDFVGVYLLTDDFRGEAYADDFALREVASSTGTSDGGGLGRTPPPVDVGAALRRSPVFGLGPRKGDGTAAIDNEYLLVVTRFGLVGLAAYLAVWASLLLGALRRARVDATGGAALAGIVVGLLAFSVVAGSFYQMQIMDVFWVVAGICLARPTSGPGRARLQPAEAIGANAADTAGEALGLQSAEEGPSMGYQHRAGMITADVLEEEPDHKRGDGAPRREGAP